MDLSRWIEAHAGFQADKPALICDGAVLTYAGLAGRIRQAARVMKHTLGVGRGDRVAHLGTNSPDLIVLLFACARLGAMLVPLNWRLATPEHAFILADCAPKALFLDPEFAPAAAELRTTLPRTETVLLDGLAGDAGGIGDEPGLTPFSVLLEGANGDDANPHIEGSCPLLIVYTSGTTGRPKGAVLTQDALQWNAVMSQHMHDMTAEDHILTVLPMFHVGGLNIQTTPALHLGATVTMSRRFDPGETLKHIAQAQPTLTVLVPATLQAVAGHLDFMRTDFGSLRAITTGSSVVLPSVIAPFTERGVPVIQVYGSTETCPISVYQRRDTVTTKPHSTGRAGLHCEMRIVDPAGRPLAPGQPGEILIRGPNVMFEYWGNEAATNDALRGGWFHTGDIGTQDADGDLVVHDRKKHLIISGGENIYPAEVERVLAQHPTVAEVAVVGRPDPKWGEVAVAVIVPKSHIDAPDGDAILASLNGQLARFKHPRAVTFTDALPRNAMGKVVLTQVREALVED